MWLRPLLIRTLDSDVHFYTEIGGKVEPRHFVSMASQPDKLRPSRMSDAKKAAKDGEIWRPSVTTVLNVLDKAALTNWKIDQHLKTAHGMDFDYVGTTDCPAYISEIKRLTELEMDKAPSAGTDFHKSMEMYLLSTLPDSHEHYALCRNVHAVILEKNGGITGQYVPEMNFVSDMGYGGQIDLLTPCPIVLDYKTKQTADKFKPSKMAYNDHRMQLGAYRNGIKLPQARCANIFVCLEDGQIDFHEHKEEDLQKGWAMFQHALAIWKLQNL